MSTDVAVGPNLMLLRGPIHPCRGAVVLLHAISGTLFPYRHLLQHLHPSLQVHGVDATGVAGQAPLSSVRGLARRYVVQVQPISEVLDLQLVGWSFGGCIAYELGQLLLTGRRRRLRVTVVDSAPFRSSFRSSTAPPTRTLPVLGCVESELTARQVRMEAAHASAITSYAPTPSFGGDMLVVEACGHDGHNPELAETPSHRMWIAANHYSIIKEPAVGRLASAINAWHISAPRIPVAPW